MKNPKILDFLVNHGPRNGSSKFDLFVLTPNGQTPISQLLCELQTSSLYQIKGI